MQQLVIAPGKCLVGQDSVNNIGSLTARFGSRAGIFGGRTALKVALERVKNSLTQKNILYEVRIFESECSYRQIDSASQFFAGCDIAICIGGGKVLDVGKAAAQRAGIACITVPTSAATCAASTALSVIHTEKGKYVTGVPLDHCPEATIIDPTLIITAPPRLLAAGAVDALARFTETELAVRVGGPIPTNALLSLEVGRGYWEQILKEEVEEVLSDCSEGKVTPAFEHVVTANILGAGIASGLCGGFFHLNIAHSIAYSLSHFETQKSILHGEAVGIGILVQRFLEDLSGQTLVETRYRFRKWGLPVTFKEIGLSRMTKELSWAIAQKAYDYLDLKRAVPFHVTVRDLSQAILEVDKD